MSEEICALCNEGFSEESLPVSVKEKGLRTLIRVCNEKELDDLSRYTFVYSIIVLYTVNDRPCQHTTSYQFQNDIEST